MGRGDLTDAEWTRLAPLLPPQRSGKGGRPPHDHCRLINGMLWRDLPSRYGKCQTVSSRFYRWRQAGVWDRVLAALQRQADAAGALDWTIPFVDSTFVEPTRTRWGPKGGPEAKALGRSRGGFSTKLHVRAEGTGKPVAFLLTPRQQHGSTVFERLLERGAVRRRSPGRPRVRPRRVAGDKAYSLPRIRRHLRRHRIGITLPRKADERRRGRFDNALYRLRCRVEHLFNQLKQYRRVATRYEKQAANYLAMGTLAAIQLWLLFADRT